MSKTFTRVSWGETSSVWSFGEIQIPGVNLRISGWGPGTCGSDMSPGLGTVRNKGSGLSRLQTKTWKAVSGAGTVQASYSPPHWKTKWEELNDAWWLTWLLLKIKVLDMKFVKDTKVFTQYGKEGPSLEEERKCSLNHSKNQGRISFVSDGLCQGLTYFSCKEPKSQYFWLYRPQGLCHNNSTLVMQKPR